MSILGWILFGFVVGLLRRAIIPESDPVGLLGATCLGIVGALGSIVVFLGTVTIIPFFPDAWATEAGGFPVMYLPVAFLMKDFLFLAASFYLLKQDLTRAALEIARN